MDPDDQQLVGRLEFDVDAVQMETSETTSVDVNSVTSTPCFRCQDNRAKLRELLHCHKAQYVIVGLVVLDCIIVIAELIVDLEILKVHHDNPAPHILHYTSIAILCIFLIELVLKIYAMGLDFFRHKLEVFDGVVVVVSFALDVAFSSSAVDGVGLLVILRLWRVTRIVNGIIMSVKLQAEKKIETLTKEKEDLQGEISRLKIRNDELEAQLRKTKDEDNNVN